MFVHTATWALLKNETLRYCVVWLVSELERLKVGTLAPAGGGRIESFSRLASRLRDLAGEIVINQNAGEGVKNGVNLMCKANGPEWYKGWSVADNVGALSGCPGFHFIGSAHPFFSIC